MLTESRLLQGNGANRRGTTWKNCKLTTARAGVRYTLMAEEGGDHYNVDEAARLLELSPACVRQMLRAGDPSPSASWMPFGRGRRTFCGRNAETCVPPT